MYLKEILFVATSLFLLAMAEAQQARLHLEAASYAGSACPEGSASVVASPDDQSLSVLFEQFTSEVGRAMNKRIENKSCHLAFSVQVPQDYSLAIVQVDYRGYNAVPRGGMNQLEIQTKWNDSEGPTLSRTFVGPLNDNFIASDNLTAKKLVWSSCGAKVHLQLQASLRTMTNAKMDETVGVLDAPDASPAVVYQLQWKRCR